MTKHPQRLVPVNASDSIVVIVKKDNGSSTIAAFFIVALLAGAAWWVTQDGPKSGAPIAGRVTEANPPASESRSTKPVARPRKSHPTSAPFDIPAPQSALPGRPAATFFEVTPEPVAEPAPEAPKPVNPFGTPAAG